MKKLLALVLCVMMFVAVIPTAAFAAQDGLYSGANKEWASQYSSNKAISNAKKNIDYIYNTLAADTVVFGTVKSMDDIVVSLAKGMFDGMDDYTYEARVWNPDTETYELRKFVVSNDTLVKNTKSTLRDILGGEIADYMTDHFANYASAVTKWQGEYGNEKWYLNSVGSTSDGKGTVYVGQDNNIFMKVGNSWKYIDKNDANLLAAVNTVRKAAGQTELTQEQWEDSSPDQQARAATILGSDSTLWTKSNSTFKEKVVGYDYDPIKYATNFANAVNDAFNSKDGAAGLQAYVYTLMQAKAAKEVSDKMDDLYDSIREWEDGTAILKAYGFNEYVDDIWDPLAFIDDTNLPKPTMNLYDITHTDATSAVYDWDDTYDMWVLD